MLRSNGNCFESRETGLWPSTKLQTTNCKTTKGGNVKKSEEGVLNSTPADLRDGTPHNDVKTSGRLLILDQISII